MACLSAVNSVSSDSNALLLPWQQKEETFKIIFLTIKVKLVYYEI